MFPTSKIKKKVEWCVSQRESSRRSCVSFRAAPLMALVGLWTLLSGCGAGATYPMASFSSRKFSFSQGQHYGMVRLGGAGGRLRGLAVGSKHGLSGGLARPPQSWWWLRPPVESPTIPRAPLPPLGETHSRGPAVWAAALRWVGSPGMGTPVKPGARWSPGKSHEGPPYSALTPGAGLTSTQGWEGLPQVSPPSRSAHGAHEKPRPGQ